MSMVSQVPDIKLAYLLERCTEVDGCLLWAGETRGGRPTATIKNKTVQIRRVVWSLANERRLDPSRCPRPNCGHALCVHPDHLDEEERMAPFAGVSRTIDVRARISATLRARSQVDESVVQAIRASDEPQHVMAGRLGLSKQYVSRVYNFETRVDYSQPFAQLRGPL